MQTMGKPNRDVIVGPLPTNSANYFVYVLVARSHKMADVRSREITTFFPLWIYRVRERYCFLNCNIKNLCIVVR
jgi:hypothetical protein